MKNNVKNRFKVGDRVILEPPRCVGRNALQPYLRVRVGKEGKEGVVSMVNSTDYTMVNFNEGDKGGFIVYNGYLQKINSNKPNHHLTSIFK